MTRTTLALLLLTCTLLGIPALAAESTVPKNPEDRAAYAVGVSIGRNLHRTGASLNIDMIAQGIRDVLASHPLALSDDDLKAAMAVFQGEIRKKAEETRKALGEKNQKEGEAFLKQNTTRPGVVVLPDGLQYKILTEGKGKTPTDTDSVVVNYRGTLLDGKEFDSSYKRGQPATLALNGVIPGWREALKLMPVGSKWQLFVPPALAYGERGAGPQIGPSATLIFEVELLNIAGK